MRIIRYVLRQHADGSIDLPAGLGGPTLPIVQIEPSPEDVSWVWIYVLIRTPIDL